MNNILEAEICIVGAGPAGAMLALILARHGIKTILVEKSTNMHREFRGESISPDSVAILDELRIMPYLDKHGYLKTQRMQVVENNQCLVDVDFNRFNYSKKFTIDIPQPILISALLDEAKKHSNFMYLSGTRCESLIINNDKVEGACCTNDELSLQIHSSLIVAADGRYGKIRKLANLPAEVTPLSRDVLWFMVTKPNNWGDVAKLCINKGNHIIILPTYPNMLRIGFNIPSGEYKKIRQKPISYLYQAINELEPSILPQLKKEVTSWANTTLLDIFTAQAPTWARDGLILIGDAAHTLSPVLGQGVNQAIKDAVMLAPIIQRELLTPSKKIFASNIFDDFINQRKTEKQFVHQFQIRQEKILSVSSWLMTKIRRMSYRLMNRSHRLQNKIWGQLLYKYQSEKTVGR